jgi:hypothetical protein
VITIFDTFLTIISILHHHLVLVPSISCQIKAQKLNNEIQLNNCKIDSPIDNDVDENNMSKITLSSTVVYAKQLVLYVYSRDEREVHFRPPSNSERIVLQRRRIGSNELESLWIDWYALGNLMDLDRRNVIIKFRISYLKGRTC